MSTHTHAPNADNACERLFAQMERTTTEAMTAARSTGGRKAREDRIEGIEEAQCQRKKPFRTAEAREQGRRQSRNDRKVRAGNRHDMSEPERLHVLVQAVLFEVQPVSRGRLEAGRSLLRWSRRRRRPSFSGRRATWQEGPDQGRGQHHPAEQTPTTPWRGAVGRTPRNRKTTPAPSPFPRHESLGRVENAHIVRFPRMIDASQRAVLQIALPRILQQLEFVNT